ncbi:MAG: ABC transporter permease [Oscillospiraceae bacterium]|jgi:ABC-2 type transport system permease protein|nr:ABC transporter permease [Oscillospiraceae bacterium]
MSVVMALWFRNLKLFVRNRAALVFNLIFPFFFLFVFGKIFQNDFIENPATYMLAGIIISTVFDSSLRMASSTIDDITSGFMKEVIVSPVSRLTIATGQFFAAATVSAIQGVIIFVAGFFIGLKITTPLTIIYAILLMVFVGLIFAGFGLFIATVSKNIQTFQAVSLAITMPMTFMSGAYIPISMLPDVLKWVAYFNPMTYAVSLFRTVTLEKTSLSTEQLVLEELAVKVGSFTVTPMMAFAILAAFGLVFLVLSTRAFVKIDFSRMNRNKEDSLTEEI